MHPLNDDELNAVRGGMMGAGGITSLIGMIPQIAGMFGKKNKEAPQQTAAAQQIAPQAPPIQSQPPQAMGGDEGSGSPRVSIEISTGAPLPGGSTTTRTV
jgi:hypothetical protein